MTARAYDLTIPSATCGADAIEQAAARARAEHPTAARVQPSTWRHLGAGRYAVRVRITTNDVPGWYAPWTGPAKAYPVAESVQAAMQGLRRARRTAMFHLVPTSPDAARACVACGRPCADPSPDQSAPDRYTTGYYHPKTKTVELMHYACSWGATMQAVYEWGARMR